LITVVCWGFNFVALKLIYREVAPSAVALTRFVLMYAVLACVCRIRGQSLSYPPGTMGRLWLIGALSMGLYIVLFMEGMYSAGAAEGAIVLATAPVFTTLIAIAFRQEAFSFGALAGALLALGGVALVVGQAEFGGAHRLEGDLLVLLSAVVWAFSIVLARPLVLRMDPVRVLTLSMPGALLVLFPFGIRASLATDWAHLNWVSWLSFLHVSVLAGALGFIGFYRGLQAVGAAGAMLYQFFVPAFATVFAWLILQESLAIWQFVGFGVILAGVGFALRSRKPLLDVPLLTERSS
jgi:drug/metabolite transporter (DMT)-like permease